MAYLTGFDRDASGRLNAQSSGTPATEHGFPRVSGAIRFAVGTTGTFSGGFLREAGTGAILVTTNTTGAHWETGYLRHVSGALIVSTTATKYETGFMRGPGGELSLTAIA
jgi:hypothetical protein